MAKIITDVQQTSLNPFGKEDALYGTPDKFVDPYAGTRENQSLENLSNITLKDGFSLYGNSEFAKTAQNERLAKDETALGLAGKFLYNTAVTVGTEIAKVPGYLGGGVAAGVGALADKFTGENNDNIGLMVDNFWVNAFEKLDESAKEALPVYISQSVQEGDLIKKISSGAWWATTGADGVGFLLSMMVPGQILKAFGIGAEIANAAKFLANDAKMGKLLSKAGAVNELMSATGEGLGIYERSAKFANSAGHAAAATMNTFLESASEGANTYDNVFKQAVGEGLTEDQAREKAGNAASKVFAMNLPLLMVSNMLDEAWLWKGFTTEGQKKATNSILKDLIVEGRLNESLSKLTTRDLIKKSGINFLKSTGKEGLLEEGLQFQIQDVAEKHPEDSIFESLNPVKYFNDILENPEMQESVFLGSVLGGGMSVIQTRSEVNDYNRQMFGTEERKAKNWLGKLLGRDKMKQEGIANIVKEGFVSSYRTLQDVAKKDEQGNILTDEKGRIKVDETKLAELAEDKAKLVHAHFLYDQAVLENDKLAQSVIGTQLAYNALQPFIAQEGGLQIFKEYAQGQLTDNWKAEFKLRNGIEPTAEQVSQYTTTLVNQAEKLQKTYDEVFDTHYPEKYITIKPEEKELFNDWKNKLFNQKLNSLLQYSALQDVEQDLARMRSERGLNPVTGDLVQSLVEEKVLDENDLENASPFDIADVYIVDEKIKEVPKQKKELRERYKEFFEKNKLQESWKEYKESIKQDQEELKTEVEKTIEEAAQNIEEQRKANIATLEALSDEIKNAGYDTADTVNPKTGTKQTFLKEQVLVKDKKGNVLTLKSKLEGNQVNTYATDNKGRTTLLTAKTIKDLGLKVISKEQQAAEQKLYNLQARQNAMLRVIDEVLNHKQAEYDKFNEAVKKIEEEISLIKDNNKVDELQAELDERIKNHEKLTKQKKSANTVRIKKIKNLLSEVNKQLDVLKARRDELNLLKEKFKLFVNYYTAYRQQLVDNPAYSFSRVSKKIDQQTLDLIDKLENDTDLSKSLVETENAIQKIDEHIESITKAIAKLESARVFLQDLVDKDKIIKQFIYSAGFKEAVALENLERILNLSPALQKTFDYIKSKIQDGTSYVDLMSDINLRNRLFRQLEDIKNILAERGVNPDETFQYILDNISDLKLANIKRDKFLGNLSLEDMQATEDQLFATNEELNKLNKELEQLKIQKELQQLNKQRIVLDEILTQKVQNRFAQYREEYDEQNLDPTQVQQVRTTEPREDVSDLSEQFYESNLGTAMFPTTGLNILFDRVNGKNEVYTEGPNKGLPVLNETISQQVWFEKLDEIARVGDISKYKLRLYNPKYDNSNELEQAIGLDNPNPDKRTNSDLFAILVDENNNPVKFKDTIVFTGLWRPSTLYKNGNPRLAPNTVFNNFLRKFKVAEKQYNSVKDADDTTWSPADQKKLKNAMGISEDVPFKVSDVYKAAVAFAEKEYTEWYNNAVNAAKSKEVFVTPEAITNGHIVQRLDDEGKPVWNSVLKNVPGVTLVNKTFGPKQLHGARVVQATTVDQNGKAVIKIGNKTLTVNAGDTLLVLNNEENFVPLQARLITNEEAKLVMYLMSLGLQGFETTVSLPEKSYYDVNGQKVSKEVKVFAYTGRNNPLKNFSLLHSLINYGRKSTKGTPGRKGEVYVATKVRKVVYTDWDGIQKNVSLEELAEAVNQNKFDSFNDDVSAFFNFLKNKRFNISQNFIKSNTMFLMPKLKRNQKGEWTVDFETGKSYYDYLFGGSNPIAKTNAVQANGYPMFAGRNIHFNPKLEEAAPTAESLIPDEQSLIPDDIDSMIENATMLSPEMAKKLTGVSSNEEATSSFDEAVAKANLSSEKKAELTGKSAEPSVADVLSSLGLTATKEQNLFEQEDPYADKVLTPDEMLRLKIQNNEIIQQCQ